MKLDVDKTKMTILGVEFDDNKIFKSVWYAVSSNMIEGWKPEPADIIRLRDRAYEIELN